MQVIDPFNFIIYLERRKIVWAKYMFTEKYGLP